MAAHAMLVSISAWARCENQTMNHPELERLIELVRKRAQFDDEFAAKIESQLRRSLNSLRIWQFTDPKPLSESNTTQKRWIAAPSEAWANQFGILWGWAPDNIEIDSTGLEDRNNFYAYGCNVVSDDEETLLRRHETGVCINPCLYCQQAGKQPNSSQRTT